MSTRVASGVGVLAVLAGSALITFSAGSAGDYPAQVGPAVNALAHGNLSEFFAVQPVYGSFSVLVRAPFAALGFLLGDGSELLVYRLGVLPSLVAIGLLGLYLARLMARRGQPFVACATVAVLTLVNPATLAAVDNGHPEDLLATALSVGAVLAAIRGRSVWAGVLLGLGLATKQWAVIAVLPVLLASWQGRRVRTAVAAGAVAAALVVPLAVAQTDRFVTNTRAASGAAAAIGRFNVWWPVSSPERLVVFVGDERRTVTVYRLPRRLAGLTRPLIVLLALPLSYLFWRRRHDLRREDTLALLALLLLLRSVLDPANNAYYHLPFLVSLIAWEGLRFRGLPVLSLLAAAALWATFQHALLVNPALNNAFYLAWTVALGGWLALWLYSAGRTDSLGRQLWARRHLAAPVARPSVHVPTAPRG